MHASSFGRKRRIFIFILGLSTITAVFYQTLPLRKRAPSFYHRLLKHSYFEPINSSNETALLDTPTCFIPHFQPWSSSVSKYFWPTAPLSQICAKYRHWSYINPENKLVYNESAIRGDGYFWALLSCCVSEITRSEEDDDIINYSTCTPSKSLEIELTSEFYMVTCHLSLMGVTFFEVYRDFHAITPPIKETWHNTRSKAHEEANLPNIVILGIDSTSRLNFRRLMPRTVAKLESLGAVEMVGYTKVGDNTFPNVNALLSGQNAEDLRNNPCYPPAWMELGNCPWIFKYLAAHHGYLTALIEDAPYIASFNYDRVGFIDRPVDYYLRPFMMAVRQHEFHSKNLNIRNYYEGCVGHRTNDETLLDYSLSILDTARKQASPKPAFILSWSTAGSHDDLTGIAHSDSLYAATLATLETKGHLDNTLLIMLSDHGVRFGPVRETRQGWYEDKLPAAWIHLGANLVKMFPQWENNLRINARRLSSPFVLHATFPYLVKSLMNISDDPIRHMIQKKINFLEGEIPLNTTCRDVRIPELYCPCHYPHRISISDGKVSPLALEAVRIINDLVLSENKCSQLRLGRIIAAGSTHTLDERNRVKLVVVIELMPGHFIAEATADFHLGKVMGEPNIYRISKMETKDVDCLWRRNAEVEMWCHCLE